MSFVKERSTRRDRVTVLSERVASLREQNAAMKKKEKHLEEAREQIFRACLEAEKQRELARLALRRAVSCKSKSLKVHNQEAPQSISSVLSLSCSCSMSSVKDCVSVQDSGLGIHETEGLRKENRVLTLENAKLQSELVAMEETVKNQRATIAKGEMDLQESRQKWRMFEDRSSLLALHAEEVSKSKELLVDALELREKQLDDLKVKNSEMMKNIEEKHAKEKEHNAFEIKELEDENAELKKHLQERDIQNQAIDMVSAVICKCLSESCNEDLVECLRKKKILEDEVALLKTKNLDHESKIAESVSLLQESKENCKGYEEKVSLLTNQLDEANKSLGISANVLALKEREIEAMKVRNGEEIRKLTDDNQEKASKELLRNELLEQEIAMHRITQSELDEKVKEQEILLKSKQATFDAILRGVTITCENEAANHQEEIEKLQMRIEEGEDRYKCLLDKASMLVCDLIDLKEWKWENSEDRIELLNDQAEKVRNANAMKSQLKWFKEKCCKLEESSNELGAKTERLQLELDSREEEVKHLYERLTICYEKLNSKDIAIEQLSAKKRKRCGLRRLLCC